jgi:hypothetical protein
MWIVLTILLEEVVSLRYVVGWEKVFDSGILVDSFLILLFTPIDATLEVVLVVPHLL